MREVLEIVLENAGYTVSSAEHADEAIALMEEHSYDVVLTDLRMGSERNAGLRMLSWIQENSPSTPAIMMTAHGSVETAVDAMKRGALDYIQKPFKSNDEIRLRVERAIAQRNLLRENEALRHEQARYGKLDNMIGKSKPFIEVVDMIRKVANLPSSVAIFGESGVGKELVAHGLHTLSNRADKPFVAINCGGIPENLLESELFGHKKGAFTGAVEDKEGLFVVANGGTLFLDEIGEMPLMLQVKLLRVLDNNMVTPVGGTAPIKVDVRVLSATNRDMAQMVTEGTFRNDLFYRLNVIPLHVPPLRDRKDDIPTLARHFVKQHAAAMERDIKEITPEAEDVLVNFAWPGNVRQLGNVLERAVALCTGKDIDIDDLPGDLFTRNDAAGEQESAEHASILPDGGVDLEDSVAEFEMTLIRQALEKVRYSQKRAAKLLGLTPRSLRYRLQKYNLESD